MKALYPDALGTPHIAAFSNSLADLGEQHSPHTRVETCGSWDMADLIWHLTEVQSFWANIIANRPSGPESYQRPERPAADNLPAALRTATHDLTTALDSADTSESAWSWSNDHTVGFSIRRQTHEAYVHYIDGVLAAGQSIPPVASELAADGIDEMVNIMLAGLPDWAMFTPGDRTVLVVSGDTGDSWALRMGRATGMPPGASDPIDQPAAMPAGETGNQPDCTITAKAADLCLWLWGRSSVEPLDVTGDEPLAAQLREIIASETQ